MKMEDDDLLSSTTNDDISAKAIIDHDHAHTTTTTAAAFCCSKCRGYLKLKEEVEGSDNCVDPCCWLCLGLWQEDETTSSSASSSSASSSTLSSSRLRKALEDACQPYGGIGKKNNVKSNKFCTKPNHIPTVSLSGDLYLRYRYLEQFSCSSSQQRRPLLFSTYLQDLKQHLHTQIKFIINNNNENDNDVDHKGSSSSSNNNNTDNQQDDEEHRKVLEEEEQGSLSIHLLCLPPKNHPMNNALQRELLTNNTVNSFNRKRKRCNKRQQSKPFLTQGGDPRANLETRLRSSNNDGYGYGYEWISLSTAEELVSLLVPSTNNNNNNKNNDDDNNNNNKSGKSTVTSSIFDENYFYNDGNNNMTATTSSEQPMTTMMRMEYHVAIFRRPIFLYGYYTKSRRDVSQTPFVVMREKTTREKTKDIADDKNGISSNKKQAETLGMTSVEEQICNPIENLLGVSTLNNVIPLRSDHTSGGGGGGGGGGSGGGILYGMIKFHASGREDMDVRMLVRRKRSSDLDPDSVEETTTSLCHGRPFCVQIVDALRPIISSKQLRDLIDTINHTTARTTTTTKTTMTDSVANSNDNAISYGRNPMGVGISPDTFKPVPAAIFSGLQKDTESKTKHYGCYCWSKNILPHNDNKNDNNITSFIFHDIDFPLTIQQRTPVRVLHRRCNMIRERKVLCATATRIDDHHFRLEISTQAGTYVKEFVYGDFGRTVPSVSSIMGCKTNLLKLDCEGIEIPSSPSSMDINGDGGSSSTAEN